jgi:esterase/lipase
MKLKSWLKVIFIILSCFVVFYLVGPAPSTPNYSSELPTVPQDLAQLYTYIKNNEARHKLKPNNEARIIWANDSMKKTSIAIVYVHGFSASQEEGSPTHTKLAKAFGCNLYLTRMAEHGIDSVDNMINFTVDKYWESAKEAYAIGKTLGDKVLLVGCSTGGTLDLMLAGEYPDIIGLVNLSPNIRINDPNAWILNNHWGLQIARMVLGGNDKISDDTREIYKQYWYWKYRLESVTQLEELLETKMNKETFAKVKQPVLDLYYYKSEKEQDDVVKAQAIIDMHAQLGTPVDLKVLKAMPNTGNHVMGSYIKSKDLEGIYTETEKFCIEKLGMKK